MAKEMVLESVILYGLILFAYAVIAFLDRKKTKDSFNSGNRVAFFTILSVLIVYLGLILIGKATLDLNALLLGILIPMVAGIFVSLIKSTWLQSVSSFKLWLILAPFVLLVLFLLQLS